MRFSAFLCGKLVHLDKVKDLSYMYMYLSGKLYIIFLKSITLIQHWIQKKISFCGERKHINIGWWPNNTTALSGEEKHLKWHFFYNTLTCGLIVSVTWSKSKLLIIRPMGIEGVHKYCQRSIGSNIPLII